MTTSNMSDVNTIDALKKINPDALQKVMKEVFLLDLDLLEEEEGFNPRDYNSPATIAHIESLAKQWADDPSQIPSLRVIIKEGRVLVRDGHCRRRGALIARARGTEVKQVRCERVSGDEFTQNLMILTSQEGLKLNSLELGVLYERYIQLMNLSAEELGSRINKTGQHVRDILAVNALPASLKHRIANGVIGWSLALKLYRASNDEAQLVKDIDDTQEMLERQLASLQQAKAGSTSAATPNDKASISEGEAQAGGIQTDLGSSPSLPTTQPQPPKARVTEKAMRKNKGVHFTFTREVKEASPSVIKDLTQALRTQQVVSSRTGHAEIKISNSLYAQIMSLSDILFDDEDDGNLDNHPHAALIVDESESGATNIKPTPKEFEPIVQHESQLPVDSFYGQLERNEEIEEEGEEKADLDPSQLNDFVVEPTGDEHPNYEDAPTANEQSYF